MALPATDFLTISLALQTISTSRRGFGQTLLLGVSAILPTSTRIKTYANIDEVARDFPTESEEYKAASIFFQQDPRPTELKIGRWLNVPSPAILRCGSTPTTSVAQWMTVTDGAFDITIDGVLRSVSGLDFSAVVTLDNVATVITNGLVAAGAAGAICEYKDNRFRIQSGTFGTISTITNTSTVTGGAGTDISGVAATKYLDGAVTGDGNIENGLNQEGVQSALNTIENKDANWYNLICVKLIRDNEDAKSCASWAETRVKNYFTVTQDINTTIQNNTTCIAAILNSLSRLRSIVVYNALDEYSDAAFAGYTSTVLPGSDTAKFKRLRGVTLSDELNTSTADAIRDKKCNIFVTSGGIGQTSEGTVAAGEFIDVIRGRDKLVDALYVELNILFNQSAKIPYTDAGAKKVGAAMSAVADESIAEGFLAEKNIFDESGRIVGIEPAYTIDLPPPELLAQSFRAGRIYGEIGLFGNLANAIHFVGVRGALSN